MGRGKVKLFFAILTVILLTAWVYKTNVNAKLTPEEKLKIISLVNSYYDDMMDKNYEGALKLMDITDSDYDKAITTLNNNKEYTVQRSLEGNSWIVPSNGRDDVYYDKERKCFHTLTGALIIYKNDNYAAIENVYVKKVGKNFRIINITTDDRFGYIRGSSVKGLP